MVKVAKLKQLSKNKWLKAAEEIDKERAEDLVEFFEELLDVKFREQAETSKPPETSPETPETSPEPSPEPSRHQSRHEARQPRFSPGGGDAFEGVGEKLARQGVRTAHTSYQIPSGTVLTDM